MIGPNAKDASKALADALEDREVPVRLSAAASLALIDPGHKDLVPALITWFKGGTPRERWSAAEILGQVGADAETAIPSLLEALKDKTLRGVAADALGGIGPKARAAVPNLVKLLKDDDTQVRYSAAVALARIGGPGTQPAVPILMEMWTVKGDGYNASLYIAAIGPEAKETVPFLLKNINYFTAWTLWSVDPRAAIPHLQHADISNDANYRHCWSSAYFRMVGPRTKEMAEALAEGLRDGKVPPVASWATNLLRTEAKTAVPILIGGLKSNDVKIRVNSATVLGQIGPAAKEAVAALEMAAKGDDARVREAATQALKQVQTK